MVLEAAEARVLLTLTCWSGTILSRGPPQIPFKMNLNLKDRAGARLAPEGSHQPILGAQYEDRGAPC